MRIYALNFHGGEKKEKNLLISAHFYAAGENVGAKAEQGKKNNKRALTKGNKGQA